MVRAEGREDAPLRIEVHAGGVYCEVGRGGVPARGDEGRRIEVEERRSKFVRDSVCEGLPEVRGPQFINFNLNY